MRIQIHRTGGFAGVERRVEVDTSQLDDESAWHALAEKAADSSEDSPPAGVPDGFRYRVTIDDRTVYGADPGMSDALRTLISWVLNEGA